MFEKIIIENTNLSTAELYERLFSNAFSISMHTPIIQAITKLHLKDYPVSKTNVVQLNILASKLNNLVDLELVKLGDEFTLSTVNDFLRNNVNLQNLSISKNNLANISEATLDQFFIALGDCDKLLRLNLANCNLHAKQMKQLATYLQQNLSVIQLNILNNKPGREGYAALENALERNSHLLQILDLRLDSNQEHFIEHELAINNLGSKYYYNNQVLVLVLCFYYSDVFQELPVELLWQIIYELRCDMPEYLCREDLPWCLRQYAAGFPVAPEVNGNYIYSLGFALPGNQTYLEGLQSDWLKKKYNAKLLQENISLFEERIGRADDISASDVFELLRPMSSRYFNLVHMGLQFKLLNVLLLLQDREEAEFADVNQELTEKVNLLAYSICDPDINLFTVSSMPVFKKRALDERAAKLLASRKQVCFCV